MDEMLTEERRIDEAIESYPLAPLPPGFTQQVMAQVQHTPQLDVTFRLQFIDLALPAFITAFVTAVSLTILWLTGYWEIEGIPAPDNHHLNSLSLWGDCLKVGLVGDCCCF